MRPFSSQHRWINIMCILTPSGDTQEAGLLCHFSHKTFCPHKAHFSVQIKHPLCSFLITHRGDLMNLNLFPKIADTEMLHLLGTI